LERQIFETAAHARPCCIPKLILVAWRVKRWVEPLLYRTVIVGSFYSQRTLDGHPVIPPDALVSFIQHKAAFFFAHSVRALLMTSYTPVSAAESILSACSGVENLWISGINYNQKIVLAIAELPLKRLYCNLEELMSGQVQLNFTHRLFSRLTHLELLPCSQDMPSEVLLSGLAQIPHLGHLAFDIDDHSFLAPLTLLRTCVSLRVLVELYQRSGEENQYRDRDDTEQLAEDPRYVMMECASFTADWQMGAHAGVDYWSRAEAFIAKRISGEIDALQYFIQEDKSENLPYAAR